MLAAGPDTNTAPPPPPPPGPWRSAMANGRISHASPPLPPWAEIASPPSPPDADSTITLPPAPPPPPASLSVALYAAAPLAEIVAVPLRFPVRMITIPPPAAPLLARLSPGVLFRLPAPPPPPITTWLKLAGYAAPPRPPLLRLAFQAFPPVPPTPPFPPPAPPEFWLFAVGFASVPPPPAFPGAPLAMLPLG